MPTTALKLGTNVDDGSFRPEVILPSWLLSILTHVVLFVAMSFFLRGCSANGSVGPKAGNSDFREIGLHLQRAPIAQPQPANADAVATDAMTRDDGKPQPEQSILGDDSTANNLLSQPADATLPTIGPGIASSLRTPSDAKELIKSSGRRNAGGDESSGLGNTTFFDIEAKGNRFAYVLDRSGSMYDHGAIRVAKEELVASLAALEPTQQFQVVFYNQSFLELTTANKPQMQWATDINRTLARQFISGIQADGGTDHMPALKKALAYQPDHLFFLTDADQPILSARELNEIKTRNAGRTTIHCIEFGRGSELSGDNFLKKLARENGGTYRYRDVTRFDRRSR